MGNVNMLPECRIFAGPNGSGKSTVTKFIGTVGDYINADDIARASGLDVLDAARLSDNWRRQCILSKKSFTSETVLSTGSKLQLMDDARNAGFFIKGIFVFTRDVNINISRVSVRVAAGGHNVPVEKIISRYFRSLLNLPGFVELCDVCHVIDNTDTPVRIYKKRKDNNLFYPGGFWMKESIVRLIREGVIDRDL